MKNFHVVFKIDHDHDHFCDREDPVHIDFKESISNADDAQVERFAESLAARLRTLFRNAEYWWIDAISVDADNLPIRFVDSWQIGDLTSWRDV